MATGTDASATRAIEALLFSHGGFSVLLRMPGNAASGADAEQLGLSTPIFQELPIGPAVWRRTGDDAVLMIAAADIAALLGSATNGSAQSLFQTAVGVVVDGALYAIQDAKAVTAGSAPCAYVLTLQAPAWR